ncbi:MAG: HPP family protein [Chloroflexota bacterium]|nr:HPP family protein [Chloroflexota bacterium]MDE2683327.1 HPP family protein [Chloroflexota bacterium]
MAERADAESGDIGGQRATGETGRTPRRRSLSRRAQLNARRYYRRHVRDRRGRYHAGFLAHLLARGELQVLPRRISRKYHLPLFLALYNVQFFRLRSRYLWQAMLAALVMLGVLLLVDSIADAVLAAGLGSSAVIVFVHPNSSSAALRHLVGGHLLGLAVGALTSFILFHTGWVPVADASHHVAADIAAAITLGVVILLMSATDTEHPPAAATGLGFALQSLEYTLVLLFVAAVLMLAAGKVIFRRALRDLD